VCLDDTKENLLNIIQISSPTRILEEPFTAFGLETRKRQKTVSVVLRNYIVRERLRMHIFVRLEPRWSNAVAFTLIQVRVYEKAIEYGSVGIKVFQRKIIIRILLKWQNIPLEESVLRDASSVLVTTNHKMMI
jgi:hypothetical protein